MPQESVITQSEMETIELPNEILLGEVSRLLKEGRKVIIRTKGNSMRPFIEGCRDSVELAEPSCLKENDIVLAHLGDCSYVLHRIVGINGGEFTLMGDGNLRGTEHCTGNDICGVVLSIIRENGRILDCSDASFRRRAILWRKLLPIRRYLLYIYRKIHFIK